MKRSMSPSLPTPRPADERLRSERSTRSHEFGNYARSTYLNHRRYAYSPMASRFRIA